MAAGCSMADMAEIEQVENCWEELGEVIDTADVTPVTYVNSAASLKAFCGRHGGIVCTSTNARAVLDWAFAKTSRVLFFPDQHLGRNTAQAMGIPLEQMPVWDPYDELGGNTERALARQPRRALEGALQRPPDVPRGARRAVSRRSIPASRSWSIPSARWKWSTRPTSAARPARSSAKSKQAPAGTKWAIGTELHLVNRLKHEHPEQEIHFLSPVVCMCATMYRIDLAHLCWSLENLAAGTPVNVIEVDARDGPLGTGGAGADARGERGKSRRIGRIQPHISGIRFESESKPRDYFPWVVAIPIPRDGNPWAWTSCRRTTPAARLAALRWRYHLPAPRWPVHRCLATRSRILRWRALRPASLRWGKTRYPALHR